MPCFRSSCQELSWSSPKRHPPMIPGVQSLAKEVSVVPAPLEPRNRFHALTIEEPEEPSDENVTFEEPEEPSEENFACLRSTTDSQPIEPSKPEVIYSGKSDSLSLNPGTSTMNSETGNGTSVSVPGSPEISNLSDSSNCSSNLLRLKGSLSGQDALVLIDFGSTHDSVSSGFVERSNLETQTRNKNFSVILADGRICSEPHTVTAPVSLELNDFQSTQAFTVFPLDKYDVILGKPWLAVHNPLIDFWTNYIQKRLDENEPLKESPSKSLTSRSNEASNIKKKNCRTTRSDFSRSSKVCPKTPSFRPQTLTLGHNGFYRSTCAHRGDI